MIEPISLITTLVIAGLIYYLVTLLPLPSPFPEIIRIVVIVWLIVYLLQAFNIF